MSGKRRLKVRWLADVPNVSDSHAYRVKPDGLADRAECGVDRWPRMTETKKNQCAHCKYALDRNRR